MKVVIWTVAIWTAIWTVQHLLSNITLYLNGNNFSVITVASIPPSIVSRILYYIYTNLA